MKREADSYVSTFRLLLADVVYPNGSTKASVIYDLFIAGIALISIIPLQMRVELSPTALSLETIFAFILLLDYILKWLVVDLNDNKPGNRLSFVRYPFKFMPICDFLGILPAVGLLPAAFIAFRVAKVFRLFAYMHAFKVIKRVFIMQKKALYSVLMIATLFIIIASTMAFYYEPDETFPTYFDAVCWAVICMSTMGSSVIITTVVGKIISMLLPLAGVLIVAVPTGIVTTGFMKERKEEEEEGEIEDPGIFQKRRTVKQMMNNMIGADSISVSKTRYYLRYTLFGIAINILLYKICLAFELPAWGDTFGTVLVAIAAEPALAVIVGYITSFIEVVNIAQPSCIIFAIPNIIPAIGICYILNRRARRVKDTSASKTLLVFAGATILLMTITAVVVAIISYYRNQGFFINHFEGMVYEVMMNKGASQFISTFLAVLGPKMVDALLIIIGVPPLEYLAVKRRMKDRKYDL